MITEDREYIYIQDSEYTWRKVMLSDVYYIETIKSTHYCEIVHKNGVGKIHADITPLQEELAPFLMRTKASTLANMALVQIIDTKNRILYFDDGIYCTYAQRLSPEMKRRLRLYNYRSYRRRKNE